MRVKILIGILIILFVGVGVYYILRQKQDSSVLIIDSFEGRIIGGPDATVDYGSGAGATVDVSPVKAPVYHGRQALKIVYDNTEGGYMWIARGYNLTMKNADQWRVAPDKIKWDNYDGLIFYLYGEAGGSEIAFDIIDKGREYWRFMIKDDTAGWKEIFIPFSLFSARTDWQPDSAVRDSAIDFPVNAFQFEPRTGRGTIYIDKVCLKKGGG